MRFLEQPENLHAVWDAGILEHGGLTEDDYVRRLSSWLSLHGTVALARGTVVEWALDAHRQAQLRVYPDLPGDHQLTAAYVQEERPVVERQLAKAGVRLARLLNEAFASEER